MNRFFLKEQADAINKIIDKTDISHLKNVLRIRVGELVEVVDLLGEEYIMKIKTVNSDCVELTIEEKLDIKRETSIDITVYQGIPKGTRMEYVIQKLTEIGVKKIVPVKMTRCVKDEINPSKMQRYAAIIKEAAMQSKRLIIPELEYPMNFDEMLETMKSNQQNVVFYENEQNKGIKDYVKQFPSVKSLGIVIGPEGGIDDSEIEKLKQANLEILSLGNRILRTETAGLIASAIFIHEYDENF